MYGARRVSTFLIASLLILGGLLHLSNNQIEAGDPEPVSDETRAVPWNQVIAGTEITIAPGKAVNSSFYYPVPLGSTVLSANVTFSNIPYIPGGTNYSKEAWFNIGNAPKEYTFGIPGETIFGSWGRQNQSRTGEDQFDIVLDGTNSMGGKFVLPKNATITSATFNITGFQRPDEYKHWIYEGTTLGDMVGHVVRDMNNNYVAMGAPGESFSSGTFYLIGGSGDTITIYTITRGDARLSEFGYSISNPFNISGSKVDKVAVGGPGFDTGKGYVDIMDVSTLYTSYQKLNGNDTGDRFGEAIGAGDVNGDGREELIIGAPSSQKGIGSVYIFHQIMNSSSNNRYEFELLTVINGSSSDTDFGKCIAIGDINADKIEDIVIASNEDVYVYHGSSTLDTKYDKNFDPLSTYSANTIQNLKFLGQLTRSGAESLGIGLPHLTSGVALIHHGGATYDTTADVVFNPPSAITVGDFGYDIDVGYDYDNDGTPEVAIGAPGANLVISSGWAGIYSTTNTKTPIDEFTTPNILDSYGSSIAFGTDLGGDGYGDLVVGAPTSQDIQANRVGATWIHERLGTSSIPSNTPVVYIEGTEAWRYGEDHLSIGTTITTGDLSDTLNSYLEHASASFDSPDEGFVYVDIEVDMATFSSNHESNHFFLDSFELIYDYQRSTGNISEAFNTFMEIAPEEAKEDGMVKVPFKYGGSTEGGIKIDSVELELDLIPEIQGIIPLLHIDEDSIVTDLLDTHLIFEDDYTPDEEMTYMVYPTGNNSMKFQTYLIEDRFVAIDLINGSESANWSGMIEIYIVAMDANEGRTDTDNILIQVDPVNDAPAVTQIPDESMIQNARMQYLPRARDDEGDSISYSLKEGHHPENMSVDQLGTVIFEPNGWQIGDQYWILILDDGEDQREYNFSLEVANVNDAPIFGTPVPKGLEVLIGETLAIQFFAYDLDPMDIVRYSLPEGPTGSSIGFETGSLSWTPYIYLEGPQKFRVRAMDLEDAFTDLVFFVNVTFIDDQPIIVSTPETYLTDLIEWTYNLNVSDPENDLIFVELIDGPDGMEYDDEYTDSLTWTPSSDQIGSYSISLIINSTSYSMYHNFTLTVTRTVRDWTFELDKSLDGKKVTGKTTIGGTAQVSPGKVDGIYITIGDDPPFMIPLEGEGWSYTIDTKDYNDGELVIQVTASDSVENSTAEIITLTVANDEGGTSIILIILLIILIIVILALGIFGFLLYNKTQKKKEEEEEKKIKLEELQRSRQEVDQFIQSADHIDADTTVFDQVETPEMDQGRLDAIDDVFAPMKPGEAIESTHLESDDIPEDILQKATVQESVLGQEPPEVMENLESPEEVEGSLEEQLKPDEELPPPPSLEPLDE